MRGDAMRCGCLIGVVIATGVTWFVIANWKRIIYTLDWAVIAWNHGIVS